jgi:hypothetical protein
VLEVKDAVTHGAVSCPCRAHQLHRFFRYRWDHPSTTLKQAAQDLHISLSNAKQLASRLRRRPRLWQTCPGCFSNQLFHGVCQNCGEEPAKPEIRLDIRFDQQSPSNSIQSGNGLGGDPDIREIKFENNSSVVIQRRMNRVQDSLLSNCKSDVLEWLKGTYPREDITDLAGRLVVKEVSDLRARYPLLTGSKNLRPQVVQNVKNRLILVYPFLRSPPASTAGDEVTSPIPARGAVRA